MRHIHSLAEAKLDRPSMVTIGVFDGVHRGHQHVVAKLLTAARVAGAVSVVLTFYPYPELVIRGPQPRHYLTLPDEKAALLHDLGVELVITHPFNDEVRHIRAATFVDRLLTHLRMAELWVGADFAMGYKREGNVDSLKAQASEKGFALRVVNQGHEPRTTWVLRLRQEARGLPDVASAGILSHCREPFPTAHRNLCARVLGRGQIGIVLQNAHS